MIARTCLRDFTVYDRKFDRIVFDRKSNRKFCEIGGKVKNLDKIGAERSDLFSAISAQRSGTLLTHPQYYKHMLKCLFLVQRSW